MDENRNEFPQLQNLTESEQAIHTTAQAHRAPKFTLVNIICALLIVVLTASLTYWFAAVKLLGGNSGSQMEEKTGAVAALIDTYFVDEYDPQAMEKAAADGAAAAMVESIGDEWSYYITAEEMQAHDERLQNTYVGVGMNVRLMEDGIRVVSAVEGGPAENAGVQSGDYLVEVDGVSVKDMTLEEVTDLVKGEAGTDVTLGIQRQDALIQLTMTRAGIISVVAHGELLDNGIGLIKIDNFDQYAAEQTMACVRELMEQGATSLIFDVRFNPGGLSTEMVNLLDQFLPEGDVFVTVDYRGNRQVERSDAAHLDIPVAVLVNYDSYSASEFFAAALQDYGRAVIVGSQTYGKGHFQTTLRMKDGSGLNLSIGRYYTPKGNSLIGTGVTPDIVVDLNDTDYENLYFGLLERENDPQLQAAIQFLSDKNS